MVRTACLPFICSIFSFFLFQVLSAKPPWTYHRQAMTGKLRLFLTLVVRLGAAVAGMPPFVDSPSPAIAAVQFLYWDRGERLLTSVVISFFSRLW